MMTWAETAAKNEGISRDEADRWAFRSHQRAIAAIDSGKFKAEIVPVEVKQKKEKVLLDTDETPRRDTTLEKLASLRTVYEDGICTAGNSSSENDGAAALVLTTPEKARGARCGADGLCQVICRCRSRSHPDLSRSTGGGKQGP